MGCVPHRGENQPLTRGRLFADSGKSVRRTAGLPSALSETVADLSAKALLTWNKRRNLAPDPIPGRRVVVEFRYSDLPKAQARYCLIVAPGTPVDLCSIDAGHEIDLLVTAELRAMTFRLDGSECVRDRATRWAHRAGWRSSPFLDFRPMDRPRRLRDRGRGLIRT
jgi:hypothetical protein